ncbi:flavodoxin domain-containing protein [Sedimentitalea sp.]|uniref:flavodoxin domain-containing protein n=1 Tax=Sedimentitalea sp. TaxID=2048915 RepID=UPI003298A88A
MKILICYATTEGQTRKIARFCADQLFAGGHNVEVLAVNDAEALDLAGFDAAILAGSVHIGRLQRELATFAEASAPALNGLPTKLLVVSLSAAGGEKSEMDDLDRMVQAFCHETGWTPGAVHHVAGAFRFTEYDFFKFWALRWIAARKGQKVDPNADMEYTDWAVLADLLKDWPGPQSPA